jgi:hypothetical protein
MRLNQDLKNLNGAYEESEHFVQGGVINGEKYLHSIKKY